ncbi:unnamed protein product [Globisporangium polare]
MEDEFYRDLLGDFDGKLLEIQLDDDSDDREAGSNTPQSLVVDCSAVEISLAVSKRAKLESPEHHEHEDDDDDEAEWLRMVLRGFDVDVILSEFNSSESHATEAFDQLASILDTSLVDIDFEPIMQGEELAALTAMHQVSQTPRGFGEYLLSPVVTLTPAPMAYHHHLALWSAGAVLHRQQVRRRLESLPPSATTVMLPPVLLSSCTNSTNQCQHPQCPLVAVMLDMCYAHADGLFEQPQLQTTARKKTQTRKRRRAVFSTSTKERKVAKTTEKKAKTSAKAAKEPTKKQLEEQQQQEQQQKEDSVEQQEAKARTHIRPLRSRRISYGEAA